MEGAPGADGDPLRRLRTAGDMPSAKQWTQAGRWRAKEEKAGKHVR